MVKYIRAKYLSAPEKGKHTYMVEGEYGGYYTNYQEAVKVAKWCSTLPEYDYECIVWVADSMVWYDKFRNGRLVEN